MGVQESYPKASWTKSFMINKVFHFNEETLYQDNHSEIILKENVRVSSSGRTKHINIRYFFINEHIDSVNVNVKYFPTEEMVTDLFTKPLQGRKFREFIGRIMVLIPDQEWVKVPLKTRIRAEECVGTTADSTIHVSLNSRPT